MMGAPNMTARSFCSWVNDELLPSSDVEVSRNWLHSMGFKGLYYDGHKREDVIEDRKMFLKDMCQYGVSRSNSMTLGVVYRLHALCEMQALVVVQPVSVGVSVCVQTCVFARRVL